MRLKTQRKKCPRRLNNSTGFPCSIHSKGGAGEYKPANAKGKAMNKIDVPNIWKILNKAVNGKLAVYDLAISMYGLEENTIRDIADKIHNDQYLSKWDWRKLAKEKIEKEKWIKKIEKINKEVKTNE